MEEEIWKTIPNYENYKVSNLGNVKSLDYKKTKKEKLLKLNNVNGYLQVKFHKKGIPKTYQVHKLVAMCFLSHTPCNMEKVINHKNFIRSDNRIDNLEITSCRENGNKKHIKSSSKHTGVSYSKSIKKWESYIFFNGKKINLGIFTDELEASLYYENALKAINNKEDIIVKKAIFSSKYKHIFYKKSKKRWVVVYHKKQLGSFTCEEKAYVFLCEYLSLKRIFE